MKLAAPGKITPRVALVVAHRVVDVEIIQPLSVNAEVQVHEATGVGCVHAFLDVLRVHRALRDEPSGAVIQTEVLKVGYRREGGVERKLSTGRQQS